MATLTATVSLLQLLGDATRMRLLAVLQDQELTVAQLTKALGLGQSRVSTHLARLKEAGLLRVRKQGNSTYYRRTDPMPEAAARLWSPLQAAFDDGVLRRDLDAVQALLRASKSSTSWADRVAGELEKHYSPGRTWPATVQGMAGLMQLGRVLDVGCGDGVMAEILAPRARAITCLDRNDRMLASARTRLARFEHVDVVAGDMHELPMAAESFDQVMLFHVLTYALNPQAVLKEAARVLQPGGRLTLVTLRKHNEEAVVRGYGHVNNGFSTEQLGEMLQRAGFGVEYCQPTHCERQPPYFEVISAYARREDLAPSGQ